MLGGLIAGALKGFAEGYGTVAKGELENQQKLDYQKEILRLTEEKDRRVAEWRAKELPRLEAEGALAAAPQAGQAAATRAGAEATARRDLGVAETEAGNRVAGQVAETREQLRQDVPGLTAEIDRKKFEANKPLEADKATEKGRNEGRQQVGKTGAEGYLEAVRQEDLAKNAGDIELQETRNEGWVDREKAKPARSSGSTGGSRSSSTSAGDTSLDLERRFKAANRNLAQGLGVAENKINEELAALQRRADRGDAKAKATLDKVRPAWEDWQTANAALRSFTRKPGASAPASASGSRPPLDSFKR